jgi:hypothetical protein
MANRLRAFATSAKRFAYEMTSQARYPLERFVHSRNLPNISPDDQVIVETCAREGVCVSSLSQLDLSSTPPLLVAASEYLKRMDLALLASGRDDKSQGTADDPLFPQIFTVTDIPEFYRWGTEQRLLDIVENYLRVRVKFQGVHLRRDFSNRSPVTTELWHKDLEDRRIMKIFVYLSDVDMEAGPLEYIPKEAASPATERAIKVAIQKAERSGQMGIDDVEMDRIVPRARWKTCPVPKGSVVFADTVALYHHGRPRMRTRSSLFFVYTAARPLRPWHCHQYSDGSFPRS